MTTTNSDLTLDICAEDGSRTRFFQNNEDSIKKTLQQLVSPRLFQPPLLTLASERSISAIPTRTIDMILAHMASPPVLPLPSGWADAVEVDDCTLLNVGELQALASEEGKHVMLAEIHTVGDWMIRLKLETISPETIQEKRQLWNHLLDLPAVPFRLKTGGIGTINTANIVRVTVCPPVDGITETALPADLLDSVRA
ncbi:MAG TPA: hypothetical protein VMA13_01890 [Candidatus Saccharimonadales bacterium]|nr:hypothetical protein [Candidatus Saccharimonadales bacterium]